jgi:hypothetical protein
MGSAAGNGIDSTRYEMFDAGRFFLQDKREQLIDSIMRDPRALSPAVLDA